MRDLVKETPLTVDTLCSKGEFLKLYYGKAEKQFREQNTSTNRDI